MNVQFQKISILPPRKVICFATPIPPGNSSLASYFASKILAFKTPLPLEISNALLLGGCGFLLVWNCTIPSSQILGITFPNYFFDQVISLSVVCHQGCYNAAVSFFEDILLIIGGVALGIAVFQVSVMTVNDANTCYQLTWLLMVRCVYDNLALDLLSLYGEDVLVVKPIQIT